MNKHERNQAIEKVRELYISYRLIEGLEREIGEYTELMEYKIREQTELNNLNIDGEEGFCTSYEEKVCCSTDNTSKVERQTIQYISRLKEEALECRRQINERKNKIAEIKVEFGSMKENIDTLDAFYKQIIECICRDRKPISYVTNTLFCGNKDGAYRHTDIALNSIMEFQNWRG